MTVTIAQNARGPNEEPATVRTGQGRAGRTVGARPGARSSVTRIGLRLLVPVVIRVGWLALSQSSIVGLFVPNPFDTFGRVFTDFFSGDPGRLFLSDATYDHFFPSVGRAMAGLTIAVVVGVMVGSPWGASAHFS